MGSFGSSELGSVVPVADGVVPAAEVLQAAAAAVAVEVLRLPVRRWVPAKIPVYKNLVVTHALVCGFVHVIYSLCTCINGL